MTDQEIGMLEQICYLDHKIVNLATGKHYSEESWHAMIQSAAGRKISIGDFFREIGLTDEAIAALRRQDNGDFTSTAEWAATLQYMKDSSLSELTFDGCMSSPDPKNPNTTLAYVFTDQNNEAIVAFKGTSGGREWKDNVEGLGVSDTECQQEALDYIESLPYDHITVTGHSKGGNKAMYVAITSDKVDRCVSFDGQGFSQEFIDKYWAEIQERGGKISNYSLDSDFVHCLLFPVPNSSQIYCNGYGVSKTGEQHALNSIFKAEYTYETRLDENGNPMLDKHGNPIMRDKYVTLVLDDGGLPVIEDVQVEAPGIVMLHEFTAFIMNNADVQDQKIIIEYVSGLAEMAFDDSVSVEDLMNAALSDPDAMATVIAYLVKYMDAYDLDADDIDLLLQTLGLGELNDFVDLSGTEIKAWIIKLYEFPEGTHLNLANILNMLKDQLTDNNNDFFVKKLLSFLKKRFAKDLDLDVEDFWNKVNTKVKKINTSGGKDNVKGRSGTVRDYSVFVCSSIETSVCKVRAIAGNSVESWTGFSSEKWYSELFIDLAVKGIRAFYSKLSEMNEKSNQRINQVFESFAQIDSDFEKKLNTQNQIIFFLTNSINDMTL